MFMRSVTDNLRHVEDFFSLKIPCCFTEDIQGREFFGQLTQKQIMSIIDFSPPFLKIDKMAVFKKNGEDIISSFSLSTGKVSRDDTAGHYNDTIFLAMCGWIMGSSASVHIAALFPDTSPQVVEVDCIRPTKNRELWIPSERGSSFFVSAEVIKKRMQVILVNVKIFFGDIFMGEVERLKLILTPKDSIWDAKNLPLWR